MTGRRTWKVSNAAGRSRYERLPGTPVGTQKTRQLHQHSSLILHEHKPYKMQFINADNDCIYVIQLCSNFPLLFLQLQGKRNTRSESVQRSTALSARHCHLLDGVRNSTWRSTAHAFRSTRPCLVPIFSTRCHSCTLVDCRYCLDNILHDRQEIVFPVSTCRPCSEHETKGKGKLIKPMY
jgi:hypothetical protein